MIHRGIDTAFGGMWAFPGGKIDADVPGDAGYGLADPRVQGPRRRLVMDESAGWRYLNHD